MTTVAWIAVGLSWLFTWSSWYFARKWQTLSKEALVIDAFERIPAVIAMRAHYYSTHCLHHKHEECKVTCRHCPERCKCHCH